MTTSMQRIVFFDLDGVIFQGQSQQLLLTLARRERLIGRLDFFLLRLWFLAFRLGLTRDPSSIRRCACRLFRGVAVAELEGLLTRHRESLVERLAPEALQLITGHRQNGDQLVLVSAAISPLVRFLGAQVGVGQYIDTELAVVAGRFSGEISGPAVYGSHKKEAVRQFLRERGGAPAPITCYADHYSDLPLLEAADLAVAVNPDRRLRRVARLRHWRILCFA